MVISSFVNYDTKQWNEKHILSTLYRIFLNLEYHAIVSVDLVSTN